MPQLEIKHIYKNYKGKEVLNDINFSINRGTTLGLIGPTGCGKTTLLRIIDLLELPSSGNIFFNGEDITKSCDAHLETRRKMSMVFQKPVVFKGTVFENIYYGLKIRGIDKEKSHDRILELLEELNLEGYEYRDASTLSGGETQRIALARALITDPEILLLDEPTANLDPGSTANIESMIEDLSQKNLTIIMATHNLLQGQRLSDKIVILNKKIYQIGKPEEIFRKPKSKFVADFVGMKNVKLGQTKMKSSDELTEIDLGKIRIYSSTPLEGRVFVSIRPEDITISKHEVELSALNEFKGVVKAIKDTGTLINLEVDVGEIFTVYMTRKSFLDLEIAMGTYIWIQFKASSVHVFN